MLGYRKDARSKVIGSPKEVDYRGPVHVQARTQKREVKGKVLKFSLILWQQYSVERRNKKIIMSFLVRYQFFIMVDHIK